MRVVHLINGLGRGGGERLLVELVRGLRAEVHFDVFCLTREGPLADELRQMGIGVTSLTRETRPLPSSWPGLVRALRAADVLHTHFFYSDAVGAMLRRAGVARRWISTRHETGYWMSWRHRVAEAPMLRRADRVLCVSQAVRSSLIERGVPAGNSCVVHPGVVPCAMAERKPQPIVLSVGRLEEIKGHDVLLRAFARLTLDPALASWKIVVVGDGRERRRLVALAHTLGIAHRCELAGAASAGQVQDALARASVFVLPSRSEGLPLGLIEAMMMGLPCIASNVGGVPELLEHGRDGWLVARDDVEGLAAQLRSVMVGGAGVEAAAERATQKALERFGISRYCAEVLATYRELAV